MTGPESLSALVLGGASWNTMVYLDDLPEPTPHTVFASRSHRTVGSSGAGKALNLADLGVATTLWALLGADDEGEHVRRHLEGGGVSLVTQLDPAGTMRHVNVMNASGDRISIFENPGSLDAPPDMAPILPLLDGRDLVAITIFEHCRPLLGVLAEAGLDRWVDIHDYDGENPYHDDFIDSASHLFMSSVAHRDWRGFAERRIAAGTQLVVVTHGADGASGVTEADGWVDVPAVPVDRLVDSNGAGDAFFAGFAVAWIDQRNLAAALGAGAEQAARAIRSPDLAPIHGRAR